MFRCKIADFLILIDNRYQYLEKKCADYPISPGEETQEPHIFVKVTDTELSEEGKEFLRMHPDYPKDQPLPMGYLESICAYRQIAYQLYSYDAFLLHACTVKVGNHAFAFCARSGTGKSTHARFWEQYYGEKMEYINGDKPIIRLKNGVPVAYGTPWGGKEDQQKNISAPLKAICVLCRGKENSIEEIGQSEAFFALMHQVLHPKEEKDAEKSLSLLQEMISACHCYRLHCNLDPMSAKVSGDAMVGKEK